MSPNSLVLLTTMFAPFSVSSVDFAKNVILCGHFPRTSCLLREAIPAATRLTAFEFDPKTGHRVVIRSKTFVQLSAHCHLCLSLCVWSKATNLVEK